VKDAAARRLFEELGFSVPLTFLQTVKYDVPLDNDMREKELTHVFRGISEEPLKPHPDEIMEVRWIAPDQLYSNMQSHSQDYAAWFLYYQQNYFKDFFLL